MPKAATTAATAAQYLLNHTGEITALKLQGLLYYAQAWSLVWDERPLFGEAAEAWHSGPVIPAVYALHDGLFKVSAPDIQACAAALDQDARDTIDAVLMHYGEMRTLQLLDLSRREQPWQEARRSAPALPRAGGVITHAMMAGYYASLEPCT